MRIAYLSQSYPPMVSGASIVAEQLAEGMANRGHEILVITASDSGKQYITQKKNLTVLRLNSICNPLRVNQRSILFPKKALLHALQEFQPHLIHSHEPLQVGWAGIKYANYAGIPILLTAHQLPWSIALYLPDIPNLRVSIEKIVWKYARWIIRKFICVISPTKTVSKIIELKTGLKSITINHGINLDACNPYACKEDKLNIRAKFNIPNDSPIILHVGRLDADKLTNRVIVAVADVMKKSNAHFLVVGDGKEKPALVKLCKTLEIESRSHFTGFVSQKCELAKIYKASNIFVTASEFETQGIVLLEAAAYGLPIAAINATCIPEIIHHGCNGYLVSSGNIESLSKSIQYILQNEELAKSMSKESRLVAEKYDIETTFNKHEKLYFRLAL